MTIKRRTNRRKKNKYLLHNYQQVYVRIYASGFDMKIDQLFEYFFFKLMMMLYGAVNSKYDHIVPKH